MTGMFKRGKKPAHDPLQHFFSIYAFTLSISCSLTLFFLPIVSFVSAFQFSMSGIWTTVYRHSIFFCPLKVYIYIYNKTKTKMRARAHNLFFILITASYVHMKKEVLFNHYTKLLFSVHMTTKFYSTLRAKLLFSV